MISQKGLLNVGDRIQIARLVCKHKKFYPSQVLNIKDKDIFFISGPIHNQNLVMIHKNEKIKISYKIANKGRYTFDAIILKRSYKDIYQLEVKRISNIKRHQRRQFYRFNISLEVIKQSTIKNELKIEKCRTKDISGSGLKLYSNHEHRVGDIVNCKFQIKDKIIDCRCKIVRVEKVDTFDYLYGLGIEFIELDEKDRDNIIGFIFSKERLSREKGLI